MLHMLAVTTDTAIRAARARLAVGGMFFLLGVAYSSWVVRIPALRADLALDDGDLGLLLLAPAAGVLVAFRCAAALINRYGTRRITQVAAAATCISVILPGLAPTWPWAAVALALIGISTGLMDVAMNAHGIEVEHALGRPILGSLHGLFSVGGLAGAGLGSLAADAGLSPAWHLIIVGLALEVCAWWFASGLLPARHEPPPDPAAAPRRPRFHRILLALGAVAFCASIGEGAMAEWTALYLHDSLRATESVAALGFAAFSLAMVVARFTGDRLTQRFGAVALVRYGGLVAAAGLAIGLWVNTVAAMLAGFICVGLGLASVMPSAFRAAGRVPGVPPAAGQATMATVGYTGFLVGPPAIGFLSEQLTLRGGLGLVVALALMLALLAPTVAPAR